ncbi:hypothetical protein LOTGIDRAFT_237141 [Lottia gigantea]|uniref:Transcobalamin-like C-terminal domain-containing protein n=1 Tax=Lottia gigantea TaxID=225164 RepID=V3ZMU7_LOTGI|nr:hypothetical protein LOTGIDRAFT_237141 [Lottia gigantea]ESO82161.1 hypothetical protein LOTGIDRAFT_237141 [Lottia gigantea]
MGSYLSGFCYVKLKIQNDIQPEHFEYSVTLWNLPKQPLIRLLEHAADEDPHFKFTATYFDGKGYFIDAINGLAGEWDPDKTYWEILDSDLKQIPVGASSYKPCNGEVVTFNFKKETDNKCP